MISVIANILHANKTVAKLTRGELLMLNLAHEADPGITIRAAARVMKVHPPLCTRAADKLEALKLGVRRRDPSDKRSVFVCATAAGRKFLAGLDAEIGKAVGGAGAE